MSDKTHFRKAFDSPYLSSADIVGETALTIAHVRLETDKTKKTKDQFNTAHFVEKELRPGEKLKPMILNATNSKILRDLSGSPFIDDWNNLPVLIYVDANVRFGKETVEGLRISTKPPPDPKWQSLVANAEGIDALREVKAQMAEAWRGVTNIPKPLVVAYNTRLDELRKAAA